MEICLKDVHLWENGATNPRRKFLNTHHYAKSYILMAKWKRWESIYFAYEIQMNHAFQKISTQSQNQFQSFWTNQPPYGVIYEGASEYA